MRAKGKLIADSPLTVNQKLRIIRMVLLPAIRYSMTVAPFDSTGLNRLDGAVAAAGRKALGLSKTVTTAMLILPVQEFGVGLGTVRGMYTEVLTDWISGALLGTDRPARVTRAHGSRPTGPPGPEASGGVPRRGSHTAGPRCMRSPRVPGRASTGTSWAGRGILRRGASLWLI